jgi:predicted TIM-barrel fold metal-dependent hydrolase
MDLEGVDVNMMLPSGGIPAFCGFDDVALELAAYQAYHRFLADYCAPYPDRLTSVILVSPRDAAGSVTEIRRCCRQAWPVAVFPVCPPDMALDEPAWEAIWAEAQAQDLAVVIHSFTMTVPYPPGMWDTWDNVFLQRSAGHVWNAQRNMAALIGAGVLDRYPALRVAPLECGHGWLPFWAARLDEHALMCRHAIAPLQRRPSEYVRGPQYFQSIQLHEGEQSLRHVIEALGEDTLMFATDYPHSESWFPRSVDAVLGWTSLSETARRKLLWDNAARCYRRHRACPSPSPPPRGRGQGEGGPHFTGSVKVNVEPRPSSLSTQSRPPCSSTNFLARASPRPVPSRLRSSVPTCRNSSKMAA